MPKIGAQWSPLNLLTVGVALDQTILFNAPYQSDLSYHSTDNSTGNASLATNMNRTKTELKRNMPLHIAVGAA